MPSKFKKSDAVLYDTEAHTIRARVLIAHKDGSYTVKALFYVRNGAEVPGYLGFNYRMAEQDLRASEGA